MIFTEKNYTDYRVNADGRGVIQFLLKSKYTNLENLYVTSVYFSFSSQCCLTVHQRIANTIFVS